MNLLVIEDEVKLGDYLRRGFTENGFVVQLARNAETGLSFALSDTYDAIVLDVMLPGMDGFEFIQAFRRHSTSPVLMLTARDGVEDRVRGLEAGADDYLSKPFAFSELLARVRAMMRRGALQEPTRFVIADLQVDLTSRRATRQGRRIELTAKEFALLSLMIRRQGQVLSRSVLADQVWGMNFESATNVVEVAMRRLRLKVDDPFEPKLLHTVRGMGYVLECKDGQ